MRRAMNNQSLIGRFKKTVGWVAQRSGRVYLEYNETGTTRTCADCGAVIEGGLALDIREWECPDCHTFHLRDENAGRNGLRRVLQTFVPGSGQRAVKVTVRCTWRVTPTGVVTLPGGGTASLLEAPARGIKPGAQLPAPDPLTRVGDLISG
jgi:putative transposase